MKFIITCVYPGYIAHGCSAVFNRHCILNRESGGTESSAAKATFRNTLEYHVAYQQATKQHPLRPPYWDDPVCAFLTRAWYLLPTWIASVYPVISPCILGWLQAELACPCLIMDPTDSSASATLKPHPPLQKLRSDSSVPSSISSIHKRKACIVRLDGCRFTIGEVFFLFFLSLFFFYYSCTTDSYRCKSYFYWTHLPLDKMAAISQMTFSNAFSWMKIIEFQIKFHWNMFHGV